MQYCSQTFIKKFFYRCRSYVNLRKYQEWCKSSTNGCINTLKFFPGYSGPGIISDRNMVLRCIMAPGGRLSGITNTGQQLYGLDDIPYGLNPSPVIAILTFPASAASSGYSISNDFHASPSDGCTIFFGLYLFPYLCHFIILADSSVMKRRCSLFIKSRYRRTFTGIFSCCF